MSPEGFEPSTITLRGYRSAIELWALCAPAQNRTEKSSLEGTRYIHLPTGADYPQSTTCILYQNNYI